LRLSGFTHVIGLSGSGKTLLAISLAADASRRSQVEWINTDSKTRFIPHLRATVNHVGGDEGNVSVTIANGHKRALEAVLSLPNTLVSSSSLVVVDPITRVVDMSKSNPVMWGQELLEEALPTLAALCEDRGIDIIAVSEMRSVPEVGNLPVHSNAISKWADNTVRVCLDSSGNSSSINIEEDGNYRPIAHLNVLEDGACHLSLSHRQGVVRSCLEKEF